MISSSQRLDGMTDIWRQRLAKVFELADIGDRASDAAPLPSYVRAHSAWNGECRLRPSLISWVTPSRWFGNTIRRWVAERQAALTKILKDAFSDKPKLVGLKGGKR